MGALAAAVILACAGPAKADGAPRVVVTIKPVHALVAAVMAGVGAPTLLVEGQASPHTFTLKPSGARAINDADLFFRVGETVEPFTRRVIEALPRSVRVVTLMDTPGIRRLTLRRGATFEAHVHGGDGEEDADGHARGDGHAAADHDDHDHDAAGGLDGHIWLDPVNARRMVDYIARVLADRDPANADQYQKNRAAFYVSVTALSEALETELKPLRGRPFVVFHDAYQYLESRYGLDAVGAITVSPDVAPGARRLAEVRQKIIALHARCVFAEPQFQGRIVETVIDGTGARAGVLDPEATLLEPGPDLFPRLMRALAAGLKECLADPS